METFFIETKTEAELKTLVSGVRQAHARGDSLYLDDLLKAAGVASLYQDVVRHGVCAGTHTLGWRLQIDSLRARWLLSS